MAKEKFAAYRVLDRVGYGVGVRLQLTASQIADRRHALDVEDEKAGVVSVKEPIEFRAGEEIGITHTLTRHEETALEPVDKAASRKAKTSVPVSKPAPVVDDGPDTDEAGADQGTGEDNVDSDDDADGPDVGAADEGNGEADGDDAGGN
ncbi:hypothetical protein [Pleomorphomonas sp. JP5]|uniref:hypothetical protein n=1 Tax=Pleomorphomonas sp. JP5 TaxID=2942998 RepID=UPI0020444A82|nr:hypothetical protein [Pleomorphomonas sp. JP5]MCM5560312.1 hypothetical protein [Pleomorphomonas sp. JP5]